MWHDMSTSTELQAGIMIRMDNVSVTYPGGITALHSLSTTFLEGKFSVLLGRSGAGKSSVSLVKVGRIGDVEMAHEFL